MGEKVFQLENPFFRAMGRAADYVILNLLFVLSSLPIFTIGASLGALHEVIGLMREGKEGAFHKRYIRFWVQQFKQNTKLWMVLLLSGFILAADLYIVFTAEGGSLQGILLLGLTVLLTIWSLIFSWSFVDPEVSEQSTKERIRTALYRAVCYLPFTLVMVAVEGIPFLVLAVSMSAFAAVIEPIYLVIGCSASGWLCHILACRALGRPKNRKIEFE